MSEKRWHLERLSVDGLDTRRRVELLRAPEQEALGERRSGIDERHKLCLTLNTLRDHVKVESAGHLDDGTYDGSRLPISVDVGYQGSVDLEEVERHSPQEAERQVARAENGAVFPAFMLQPVEIVLLVLTIWIVFSVIVTIGLHLVRPHGQESDDVTPMRNGANDGAQLPGWTSW